jgi:hypothetical protein
MKIHFQLKHQQRINFKNFQRTTNPMKTEKIPNKIKIGGLLYDVKLVDRFSENGLLDPVALEITVGKNKESKMMSVLLHEIIEGINLEFCLGLEHDTIDRLEHLLFQVLRDNKLDFC